jgi:hypothetical protein
MLGGGVFIGGWLQDDRWDGRICYMPATCNNFRNELAASLFR